MDIVVANHCDFRLRFEGEIKPTSLVSFKIGGSAGNKPLVRQGCCHMYSFYHHSGSTPICLTDAGLACRTLGAKIEEAGERVDFKVDNLWRKSGPCQVSKCQKIWQQ